MFFFLLQELGVSVPGDIEALQALSSRNCYDVKFKSVNARDKCVSSLNGNPSVTISVYDPSVWVTMMYLDLEVEQSFVARVLTKYGQVIESRYCSYKDFPDVKNGTRQFRMILKMEIPSFIFVGSRRGHVRYRGQPRTCFRCGVGGHEAKSCVNVRCNRCRVLCRVVLSSRKKKMSWPWSCA